MHAIACTLHRWKYPSMHRTEHSAARPRMIYSSIQVVGVSLSSPWHLEKSLKLRATWSKIDANFADQETPILPLTRWRESLRERIRVSGVNASADISMQGGGSFAILNLRDRRLEISRSIDVSYDRLKSCL